MNEERLFDEDGIIVSPDFIRKDSQSWAVREIKKINTVKYRTDGHVAPLLWVFTFIAFVFWIAAPIQNGFMLFILVPFLIAALHKQTNPHPPRYRVYVSTGGLIGMNVFETVDQDQAARLTQAIENSIATRTVSSDHIST